VVPKEEQEKLPRLYEKYGLPGPEASADAVVNM